MIKLFHYFSFREQQRLYDMKIDGTLTYFEKIRVNHQLSKFNAFNLDFHEEDMGKDCYK